jgi:hypothetical protein
MLTDGGKAFTAGMDELVGPPPEVEPVVRMAVDDMITEHRLQWLRRAAGFDDPPSGPLTTLGPAWFQRLVGAQPKGEINPVDRAIANGDPEHAALVAYRAVVEISSADHPEHAFRLARALHHLGITPAALELLARLAETDLFDPSLFTGAAVRDAAAAKDWGSFGLSIVASLDSAGYTAVADAEAR